MKYRINQVCIAALVFLLLFSVASYAGNKDKAGTVAAAELLIPVGARDLAMGGSTVANSHGIESIFWNPAGLAYNESNATAMFSRLTYLAGIDLNYLAVAGTFGGFGTIGFTIKALDFGNIPITTSDQPDGTGGVLSPTFFTLGLHYAKPITDRVAVGVTFNFINEDLSEARVQATGFAFSAGVQYKNLAGFEGLDLGVAVKNIGPQMGYSGSGLLANGNTDDVDRGPGFVELKAASDELPSTIELGLAYRINAGEVSNLRITGLYQNNNFSDDETRFGVEYAFKEMFFVRGGYSVAPDASTDAFIFGPTFGGGVNLKVGGIDVMADYGWRQTDFFDNQNAFSIKLGF